MARKKPTAVQTDKHEGQQSAAGGMRSFFFRNVPLWYPPAWQEAGKWRVFVEKQPIAAICRDTLANYLNSLDWMVVARDPEKKDELKGAIKHYTKLFERGNAYWWEMDFSSQIEWFTKDLFTLPFGTAAELGRIDDNPKGRVVWLRPLDAGTLAPTLDFEFPIMQSAPSSQLSPVYFQREFSSRVYLSPRTELQREGWGYAPPERIWRAIEMVSTGDNYYAQFLIDTPEAGILDLMDMDKSTAEEWVKGAQDLFFGVGALKIPVLYEHEQPAKWIPFGRPPSELMYDSVTMKYASVICSGYGLTLSDIGFSSDTGGGDTLAGTIRMERVGKSSGKALAKKKWMWYANQILPDSLKWAWVDYDDERNVSKGRARLASAQAGNIWVSNRSFLPSEMRQQAIADGLISIDLPEEIDENSPEFQNLQQPQFGGSKTSNLRTPQSPSQGGQGEIIPQQILQKNKASAEVGVAKASYRVNELFAPLISNALKLADEISLWEEYVDSYLIGRADIEPEIRSVLDSIELRAIDALKNQPWVNEMALHIENKAVEIEEETLRNKALYRLEKLAEEEFIAGEKTDLAPDALAPEISQIEKTEINRGELHSVILDGLIKQLSKYIVFIGKTHLLQGKLEVDATELKENNIRVSRAIAVEVLKNFSTIIHFVYEDGLAYLEQLDSTGEHNAS